MTSGKCALTLKHGSFVESHLIPRALTQPISKGVGFMQLSEQAKPKRRWSSWYDNRLVTREGEDILADLDGWAIKYLRTKKLVWSGFGPLQELTDDDRKLLGSQYGVRSVGVENPDRLRLFFLSLLWRAAASKLPEFQPIAVLPADLETMRVALTTNSVPPINFYPVSLTQFHTVGHQHNQSPTADTKILPAFDDEPQSEVPIFRFYFDGLITHFHNTPNDPNAAELGPLVVGNGNTITVSTMPFGISRQRENLIAFLSSTGV